MRYPAPFRLQHVSAFLAWCLCCTTLRAAADTPATQPDLNYKPGVDKVMDMLRSPASQPSAMRILRGFPEEALPIATADLAGEFKDLPEDTRAQVTHILERNHSARSHAKASADAEKTWNEGTLVDAYKKVGHHDPQWDTDAIKAMIAFTRQSSDLSLFQKAQKEGCDDVLFRYFYCRALRAAREGRYVKRMDTIADAMEASDYPASRKCFALLNAVRDDFPLPTSTVALTDDQTNKIKTRLDSALKLFPACKDERLPSSLARELIDLLQSGYYRLLGDRKKAFDIVDPAANSALASGNVVKEYEGEFYVNYAWDARGSGWGQTVTQQGAEQMTQRLTLARNALTDAATHDDYDVVAPNTMLEVVLGDSSGQDEMEKWFTKAVEANPDFRAPYTRRMYYLEPKWYGSPQAKLDFGNECVATQNFVSGIPMELVSAHEALSQYQSGGWTNKPQPAYFANNFKAWDDICSAAVPTLYLKPDDYHDRSLFARDAVWCGQLAEAKNQFQILGEHADLEVFGTQQKLSNLRDQANASPATTSP